eukprot:3623458-Amphidinium_carterae.1
MLSQRLPDCCHRHQDRGHGEVTKVYRCADGRELRVYGYKWVRALVGRTQQILQIRFTVLDVLRPVIALSCLVQGRWDLSFGGAPVEATAAHRTNQRRLVLIQRTGLYFVPLLITAQQAQRVRGHVIFSFEEDVAGECVERHETALHSRVKDEGEVVDQQEQDQQECAEMKVPTAPTEEEKRYHNLTH